MKLAVTGCNGRVGRRVVKLALEQGHDVLGIDVAEIQCPTECPWLNTPQYVFKKVDLHNFDAVLSTLEGREAVIHLAGHPNPEDYKVKTHNSNVVISWNILCACGELGINRVAQASSVNVLTMVFSHRVRFHYFPIDEDHPCEPDEPYGLSKVMCELQADSIVRRYDSMRVASLRLHWSIPDRSWAYQPGEPGGRAKDLWGYVQEDSAAQAFLLALNDTGKWSGHERFFIASPQTACDEDTLTLVDTYWPEVPIKKAESLTGTRGLFDCSKAANLLGWQHKDASVA